MTTIRFNSVDNNKYEDRVNLANGVAVVEMFEEGIDYILHGDNPCSIMDGNLVGIFMIIVISDDLENELARNCILSDENIVDLTDKISIKANEQQGIDTCSFWTDTCANFWYEELVDY